jgi:hypothetical protein
VCNYSGTCDAGWTNLNGVMTDGCEYQQTSGITGLIVYQHCGSPTGWSINLSIGAYNMDPVSSSNRKILLSNQSSPWDIFLSFFFISLLIFLPFFSFV